MDQATSELFHDLKRVLSSLEECLVEGGVGVVLEFWSESFRKGSRAFLGTITCKEESRTQPGVWVEDRKPGECLGEYAIIWSWAERVEIGDKCPTFCRCYRRW